MSVDYKIKYLDIRAKLIEAVDVAFRDGFAKGMEKGQMAAQQQAMAEQQAMMASQQAGGMVDENGMPIEDDPMAEDMGEQAESAEMMDEGDLEGGGAVGGSELDEHISELENMVSKGEKPKVTDIRKIVNSLVNVRKSYKDKMQKKQKRVVSAQKQFVDNILKGWTEEAKEVESNLEDVIKEHGIKIK